MGGHGQQQRPADLITLTFDEPRYTRTANRSDWWMSHLDAVHYFSDFGFERTGSLSAYYHSDDTKSTFEKNDWNSSQLPVIHLSLVVEPSTVKGEVTDLGDAVSGATVTFQQHRRRQRSVYGHYRRRRQVQHRRNPEPAQLRRDRRGQRQGGLRRRMHLRRHEHARLPACRK